jgi:hypothetical protein
MSPTQHLLESLLTAQATFSVFAAPFGVCVPPPRQSPSPVSHLPFPIACPTEPILISISLLPAAPQVTHTLDVVIHPPPKVASVIYGSFILELEVSSQVQETQRAVIGCSSKWQVGFDDPWRVEVRKRPRLVPGGGTIC